MGKRPDWSYTRYIDEKGDYERNRETLDDFARRAKTDLMPAHSGIRAKLVPPPGSSPQKSRTNGWTDFIIGRDLQFPDVVQLIGTESPGPTSAPAIAEHVSELVGQILA